MGPTAERGSKIPRGTLAGGLGGAPEGYINPTPCIGALQANGPFDRSPTVALPCCAPRALHRRASDSAVRHPALCTSVPPDPAAPSERIDQAEPITAASVWSFSRRTGKGSRGEQGRRVLASRTTVLRDGAQVWRPRRAGYPISHGARLAAAGRYDRPRAEATHSPTATASSAQKRQEGIVIGIEPNALWIGLSGRQTKRNKRPSHIRSSIPNSDLFRWRMPIVLVGAWQQRLDWRGPKEKPRSRGLNRWIHEAL